jgi:hypothetical protein
MTNYLILKTSILDKYHLRYRGLLTYISLASFIICLVVFVGRIKYTPYQNLFQSIHDPMLRNVFLSFFGASIILMMIVSISGEEIWKAGTIILNEDKIIIQHKNTEIQYSLSKVISFKITKTDKNKYMILIKDRTDSCKYCFKINNRQQEIFSLLNLQWKQHYPDKYVFSSII